MNKLLVTETAEAPIFSTAHDCDTEKLKALWLECFEDTPAAVECFFEKIYEPSRAFIATFDDELAAMLFLIPCTLCGKKAHYLYAACTAPRFRKKRIMAGLIGFALDTAAKIGDSYSVLLPANAGLYGYYGKLGYVRCPQIRLCPLSEISKSERGAEKQLFPTFEALNLEREAVLKNTAHLSFDSSLLEYASDVNFIYGGKTVVYKNSYALVSAEYDGTRTITELIADKQTLPQLLQKIARECPARQYKLRLPFENNVNNTCETIDFGMIKALDGSEIFKHLYIGLTLD